jgi:hypothetical protein
MEITSTILQQQLQSILKDNCRYALFNRIPEYGEKHFHYTSVFFSDDGTEQQEDRYKFGIQYIPETYFKSKDLIIKELTWLLEHYIKTSDFKVIEYPSKKTVYRIAIYKPIV